MTRPTEKRLTETAIFNAIEYAMRHEPVTDVAWAEDGDYEIGITDPHSLQPFVMCLLRELEVIE